MLPLILLAAISTSTVPALDISAGCRPESSIEGQIIDPKSCAQDEQATKEKLTKEWSSYPVAARSECLSDPGSLVNSYVELLTCIEMQTWKKDPAVMNPTVATAPGAARGGSPPLPGQMGGSSASHPLGGPAGAAGHIP